MDNKIIVTIARQYGSGGREIGEKLAKRLEIPFYDKSLIQMAAAESGIDEELFDLADEKKFSNFWAASGSSASIFNNRITIFNEMPLNDRLFIIQSNMVKKLAESSSCVIVGRCSDYILRDQKETLPVFIHADAEYRINRLVTLYGVPITPGKNGAEQTTTISLSIQAWSASTVWWS